MTLPPVVTYAEACDERSDLLVGHGSLALGHAWCAVYTNKGRLIQVCSYCGGRQP